MSKHSYETCLVRHIYEHKLHVLGFRVNLLEHPGPQPVLVQQLQPVQAMPQLQPQPLQVATSFDPADVLTQPAAQSTPVATIDSQPMDQTEQLTVDEAVALNQLTEFADETSLEQPAEEQDDATDPDFAVTTRQQTARPSVKKPRNAKKVGTVV